ncbi:MAG: PAS domain-containing protein [Polyangia bacterium]
MSASLPPDGPPTGTTSSTKTERHISLDGLPIASLTVDRMFRDSLIALFLLGVCALPMVWFVDFERASRAIFVCQVLSLLIGSAFGLALQMSSARVASNIASACVLASVCLGLQGGPLSAAWPLLALVPMLLLGLQYGRRGVVFSTFALITAGCFWTLTQGRIADASSSSSLPILLAHVVGRSLVIGLSGFVIEHLLAIVRERETFLINVFRDIDIGVSVFDVDDSGELRVAALNPRIYQLLGLPQKRLLGKKHHELLQDGQLQATEPMLRRAVSTGKPQHNEDRVRSVDKHQRLLFTAVPQRDQEQQAVTRLVVSGTDITVLKAAERKLQMQAEVLANVADAVIAVDGSFRVVYVNRAAERIFSVQSKTCLGQPLEEITGLEFLQQLKQHAGQTKSSQSGTFVDPNGRELALDFSVSTQPDEDGDGPQYIAVIRDVRDRRSLEMQLLRAQKTDALGRMAGGIAHDFNNMLVVISGNAELLAESLPPDHDGQADLREIKEAAHRAAALVRQLLAFSKRQTGLPRSTNPNQVLRDIAQILRRMLRDEIELELKLADSLWSVIIDVAQLEQVMVQLLVNARDAIPKTGKVTVTTRNVELGPEAEQHELTPGRYVELTVKDTGIGMSAETMLHLFEPFFSTKASSRAVGLGLSVCYGIIRQHRGVITAQSKPGEGTTFVIWLPEESTRPKDDRAIPQGSVSDEFRRLRPSTLDSGANKNHVK